MPRTARPTAAQKPAVKSTIKAAPNKAQPPKPASKRDALDVDRADAEGMAQPQGKKPRRRK